MMEYLLTRYGSAFCLQMVASREKIGSTASGSAVAQTRVSGYDCLAPL